MKTLVRNDRQWMVITNRNPIKIIIADNEYTLQEEHGELVITKSDGSLIVMPKVGNQIALK